MIAPLIRLYRDAFRFARACPLLFLIPPAFEALQHIVEWRIGMFAGMAAARAHELDPVRMAFGSLKVLALLLPGYWAVRFYAWGDARRAGAWDGPAVRAYGWTFLYGSALALLILWGGEMGGKAMRVPTLWAMGLSIPLGLLLAAWIGTAPLDDARVGIRRSIAIMARDLPWAFAFWCVATIPPMAAHYALNYAAMTAPAPAMTLLLAIDALFVGYQVTVMSGANLLMAEHALARRRLVLRPA